MPWQQQVADTALEVDDQGRFVYGQVVLTVPRQSGKTTLLLALMTWRLMAGGANQHAKYAAQSGVDARDKLFDDYWPGLSASAIGSLFRLRKTSGHEAIMCPSTRSRLTLAAGTKKSGHGGSLDLAVLDEAFAQPDGRTEQALLPAMRARRKFLPGPQLWVVSTAGDTDSVYLKEKVDAGRKALESGVSDGTAYFEWSADEDADPTDPATWWSCIPSMGYTVDERGIRDEFATYSNIDEWRRAGLNLWVEGEKHKPVIDLATWDGLVSLAPFTGRRVFGLDMAPSRGDFSIVAAGPTEAGPALEVVDHRPGTAWVVDRVVELAKNWSAPVAIDRKSGAWSFAQDLEAAGVTILPLAADDMATACGWLYDASLEGAIHHRGDPILSAALAGAKQRQLGDAWAWSRKNSNVNISPLVAGTVAYWGLRSSQETNYDPLKSFY